MEWYYDEYASTIRHEFNNMDSANKWALFVKTGNLKFYVYPNTLRSFCD